MMMMMAGGEVSGPLPPQAGRITGSRIAMASGTHGELVSGGAGAMLGRRAATRTGPASSDIPRDRNAHEDQGDFCLFGRLFSLKFLSRSSKNDQDPSITSSSSQPAGLNPQKDFFVLLNFCSYFEKRQKKTDLYLYQV